MCTIFKFKWIYLYVKQIYKGNGKYKYTCSSWEINRDLLRDIIESLLYNEEHSEELKLRIIECIL